MRSGEGIATWRGLERERACGGRWLEMNAIVAREAEGERLGFPLQLRVDWSSHGKGCAGWPRSK